MAVTRLEQLQKLAAAQPHDPLAHYGVGLEHMNLQQWEPAIAAFDRALQADANYVAAYMQKARAELKLGRRTAALQTLQRGVALARAQGDRHAADEMNKLLETLM